MQSEFEFDGGGHCHQREFFLLAPYEENFSGSG